MARAGYGDYYHLNGGVSVWRSWIDDKQRCLLPHELICRRATRFDTKQSRNAGIRIISSSRKAHCNDWRHAILLTRFYVRWTRLILTEHVCWDKNLALKNYRHKRPRNRLTQYTWHEVFSPNVQIALVFRFRRTRQCGNKRHVTSRRHIQSTFHWHLTNPISF